MILLLSDETWERVREALPADLYAELFLADPELPADRDLRLMARAGETPEAFIRARVLREAGIEAAAETRERVAELVRRAYDAGVGPSVLSRWCGLKPTRIHEILGPRG
jgi:hypothetical protein